MVKKKKFPGNFRNLHVRNLFCWDDGDGWDLGLFGGEMMDAWDDDAIDDDEFHGY